MANTKCPVAVSGSIYPFQVLLEAAAISLERGSKAKRNRSGRWPLERIREGAGVVPSEVGEAEPPPPTFLAEERLVVRAREPGTGRWRLVLRPPFEPDTAAAVN